MLGGRPRGGRAGFAVAFDSPDLLRFDGPGRGSFSVVAGDAPTGHVHMTFPGVPPRAEPEPDGTSPRSPERMPRTALIVVDMLNRYEHEDAEPLAASVRETLPRIVALRDRAEAAGDALLIYANDNFEHWESTRDDLVRGALDGAHPELVEPIVPPETVPFLPKGRHSIFYETPMAHLLRTRGVERVVLCGQVTEQCILYSALDAMLRGYEIEIPTDAVAHVNRGFAEAALGMMQRNLHAALRPAGEVALPG